VRMGPRCKLYQYRVLGTPTLAFLDVFPARSSYPVAEL
jgi:hypothetical protein